jgi:hypothetical protein
VTSLLQVHQVGVGIGFKPPKYLVNGDVVVVEMGGIGKLENTLLPSEILNSSICLLNLKVTLGWLLCRKSIERFRINLNQNKCAIAISNERGDIR